MGLIGLKIFWNYKLIMYKIGTKIKFGKIVDCIIIFKCNSF